MYCGKYVLGIGCCWIILAATSVSRGAVSEAAPPSIGVSLSDDGGQIVLEGGLAVSAPIELGAGMPGIAPYAPDIDASAPPEPVPQNLEVVPPGPFFGFFGDINMDGVTDMSDLAILQVNFGKSPATKADGDLNGDGIVDNADFAILQAHFQNVIIPEPSGLFIWSGLLLVGGAVYISRRRK